MYLINQVGPEVWQAFHSAFRLSVTIPRLLAVERIISVAEFDKNLLSDLLKLSVMFFVNNRRGDLQIRV